MNDLFNKFKNFWKEYQQADFVKSFREDQAREQAFDTKILGRQMVPLDRIVGSVGRYQDFDRKFRLKNQVSSDRLMHIKDAVREGKPLPPVRLYKIKNEYYVLDGNHRISVAKEFGFKEIQAHILEFIPSKKTLENLLYLEKSEFETKTGLENEITISELGQYLHLLDQVQDHQRYLQETENESVSLMDAARDWFNTIYRPLKGIIEKGRLIEGFPGRTIDDLCAYVAVHQWNMPDQVRQYGIGINALVPRNMEEFRNKMTNMKESEYPEMRREITAFVLMVVMAKKEYRIIDKLFDLEEVQEIHSVHGNVDVLAKITLKRNLLSSDAETIGQFVHQKIRQIPGVVSSQTLIPGYSRIKPTDKMAEKRKNDG